MGQALEPTNLSSVREIWDENKPEKKPEADEDDQLLHALSKQAGWRLLKAHIASLVEGLDARLAESVLSGGLESQIKQDAVFAVMGKELLRSIINKVEDAAEEVNEITESK